MKKIILLLVVVLILSFNINAQEIKLNKNDFKNHFRYMTIYLGENKKIQENDEGKVYNNFDQKEIGIFKIISVDDTESIARVNLFSSERNVEKDFKSIRKVNFTKAKGKELNISDKEAVTFTAVKFSLLDSSFYFTINKQENSDILAKMKVGSKGNLYHNKRITGIYKIIGGDKDKTFFYGLVTSNAVNENFTKSNHADIQDYYDQIIGSTGFVNMTWKNLIMLFIGLIFIYMGIAKEMEPLLLVPIGFGILIGNIPLPLQLFNNISVYMIDPVTSQYAFNTTGNSVMGIIYYGVKSGIFPPLIFLGIGAMTDFTALISNPKCVLLGAAAQTGIFITFITALYLGFSPANSAAIGIIGGADGPTAIFLSSKLAPSLIGPIAIAAYSYMAMVPIIQPPIMKLLTTKKERLIKMKQKRTVSQKERILFPIAGLILTTLVAPGAIPLLGMLFFGNLLKESGVTKRLAQSAANPIIDTCTILLGLAVGASTSAQVFLNSKSIKIFILGVISFGVATAAGVLFAKIMNLFTKDKVNPLIGAAGVSAVPDSARVAHHVGLEYDKSNYLLMHAMGPNVAGVIGSAIAAGVFLGIF